MNGPIKVFIILADDALRQRLCTALADAEGLTVVGEAREGQPAIAVIHEARPDVVLLDIGTPHASNLSIVTHISASLPLTRVIVLHDEDQERLVLDALRKGALGHLSKDRIQPATIVEAARAVSRGQVILSPGIAGCMLDEVVQEQQRIPARMPFQKTHS